MSGENESQEALGERREAVPRALAWLGEAQAENFQKLLIGGFFAGLGEHDLATLDKLPEDRRGLVHHNAQEWVLVDGHLPEAEGGSRLMDLVLGPAGPELTEVQRDWLAALAVHPLSLYRVERVEAGEGLELADVLRPFQPTVWVTERRGSEYFEVGDVLGARVIAWGDGHELSGAIYPFHGELGGEVAHSLPVVLEQSELGPDEPGGRELVARALINAWLDSLLAEDE